MTAAAARRRRSQRQRGCGSSAAAVGQLGGGGGSLAEGVIFEAKKIVGVIYKLIRNAQCDIDGAHWLV